MILKQILKNWLAEEWTGEERNQWQVTVNTVINLLVPQKAENFFITCVTISFSTALLHRIT
jgi:hypothetical protein